jgi:acyl-CoA dehydrogenase
MSVALTQEQRDLGDAVADLMAKRCPESEVRRLMDSAAGYDVDVWNDLAEMGILGLLIPADHGGSGAGFVELSVVCEQMGRALLCAPYLSCAVLTPTLLLALEDPRECADVLPGIAAGEVMTTVAFAEGNSTLVPEYPETRAVSDGDGWLLTGTKTFVLGAESAERLYVQAGHDDGIAIFAVNLGAEGLAVSTVDTVDRTRRLGTLTLADTPARLIGPPNSSAALEHALDCAAIALVSEQAGGALKTMQMAADYAKTRFQFGRAIGSFQAIKHMCADMLLEAESALSAARHVAAAGNARDDTFAADLVLAQAYCADAYVQIAATNIQVHGGIGFTWEHPAHLYLRRARADAQLLGSPNLHRERYIQLKEAANVS